MIDLVIFGINESRVWLMPLLIVVTVVIWIAKERECAKDNFRGRWGLR